MCHPLEPFLRRLLVLNKPSRLAQPYASEQVNCILSDEASLCSPEFFTQQPTSTRVATAAISLPPLTLFHDERPLVTEETMGPMLVPAYLQDRDNPQVNLWVRVDVSRKDGSTSIAMPGASVMSYSKILARFNSIGEIVKRSSMIANLWVVN
jgi:hypothetical protein